MITYSFLINLKIKYFLFSFFVIFSLIIYHPCGLFLFNIKILETNSMQILPLSFYICFSLSLCVCLSLSISLSFILCLSLIFLSLSLSISFYHFINPPSIKYYNNHYYHYQFESRRKDKFSLYFSFFYIHKIGIWNYNSQNNLSRFPIGWREELSEMPNNWNPHILNENYPYLRFPPNP